MVIVSRCHDAFDSPAVRDEIGFQSAQFRFQFVCERFVDGEDGDPAFLDRLHAKAGVYSGASNAVFIDFTGSNILVDVGPCFEITGDFLPG